MNTIKFYLATSGRVADMHKDFPLFQNQFQNKLINVYVPTSILAPQYSAQYYIGQFSADEMPTDSELTLFVKNNTATGRNPINGDVIEFTYLGEVPSTYWLYIYNNNAWTSQQVDSLGTTNALDGTSVQIGMLANRRNGVIYESKKYFMRYLKTLTYQNVEYAMYERKMPKEFTKFVGQNENAPIIIFNVVNLDLEEKVITKVITSQSCNLDVMPSDELDQDPDIEQPSELERISALVDTLNAQMQTKQDKVDDSINTGAIVTTKNLVGAINDLSSNAETNTNNISALQTEVALKQDKTDANLETTNKTVVGAINELNTQVGINTTNIGTNTYDISALDTRVAHVEDIIGSGEDYIGAMSGTLDPTDLEDFETLSTQLTAFVLTKRPSVEGGDVVIYTQLIEHGTDKNYKFIYSGVEDSWTYYEIPPIEKAGNDTYGIVKGTYSEESTDNTQVDITDGEIKGVYVVDGSSTKRNIREYLNTDSGRISTNANNISINAGNIAQNTLDIQANENAIGTLNTNYGKIVDGTTAVGYAKQAEKDSLNRNIAETYLTQNLGATKQQLYDYALPRTFNDVSFIGADNKFVDAIPDTETALYTAQSTLVGDTTLFYVEKTNSNAYYELANKNSYSDTLYVSASIDCTVTFRATTQLYQNAEWITLNTELTEPVEMTQGVIRKVLFGSTLNSLTSVLNVTDGDKIKQTFEVITTTSTPITFSVYSNETYPSSFYLNTTSQTIYVAQGALGELPVYEIAGVYSNGTLTFTIPSERALNNNVQSFFKLSYSGEIPSNTNVVMQHNGVDITLVTPYNFGTQNETKVSDLEQLNCSSVENQYVWVFTTTTRETANEKYFVVDEENLDQLTQVLNAIVSNYVTTDTAQTISGIKTFSAQPVVKSIKFVNNTASPTGSAFEINNDNGYNAKIRMNGKGLMFTAGAVYPSEPSGEDFGSSGYKWRDIYLSGNLSDGTSSVSVDTLAKGILQPLTLTSTTLTDAQYTLLQNNDCILTADFASLTWAKKGTILTKPFEYSGTLRGIYITENKIGTYLINMTSKELGNGAQDIVLNQVASISADTYKNGSGNTYMQFRSNDINATKDLIANSGLNSLGTSVYRWLDLYLSGKVDFGDGATITKDSSNRVNLNYGDNAKVKVGSAETIISNRIGADSDNTQDIGRSTVRWKDLYLAGNLTDATNSIAIADIASKSYVNTSVQTASANFRGNWATWTLVPSSASDYPVDYAGSTTPTVNDYIVVADASGYPVEQGEEALAGTWRFKYSGTWATDGKNGWLPEYQVNETPFTQAQLDALNSGITSTLVGQIGTNQSNISNIQGNYVTTDSAQTISGVKTFSNGLKVDNYTIDKDSFGQLQISNANTTSMQFDGDTVRTKNLVPIGNNSRDLGSSGQKWKDLYLSGNLTDGTNSIAVADILSANSAITGATKCKITYDSKGLVTAGADLEATDIPSLTLSKISDVTATASELNVLDGITATTTELNYVDGVTSDIQTQLNGKQATLPTTTTAGQILKSTSTAGTLEWANLPESTPTDVQISGTSITSNAVANIAVQGTYNASTNKIATMSEVPNITSTDVSITEVN